MSRQRAGPLAAWTAAWFAGAVGPDEVVDAITATDAAHQVVGLAGDDEDEDAGLLDLLLAWRRAGEPVRLVLPVAGDVRGLPGPAEFRSAALRAGEAVCGGALGVVATVTDYAPSSAPTTVVWQAYAIDSPPPDYEQLTDAQFALASAIRDTTAALSAADLARWAGAADAADALSDARRASEQLNLPPNFPPRAIALLSQAERLQAALDLAALDPTAGATDQTGIAARAEALRPLVAAVRRARVAGYNAASY